MKEIVKKIIFMIFTLVVVSFLVFLSFEVIAGDPALSRLGTQATPEALEILREEMGLNAPFMERYITWLCNFVKGDMGTSYSYQMPVTEMIADKLPITVTLTTLAFVIMVGISIPLGIYTAKHEGGLMDQIIYVINQVIMATPPFFSGIIITIVCGLTLGLFTPGGYISYSTDFIGFVGYLCFPAIAIALPKAAMAIKLLRSTLIEEKKKDYVKSAYSRGNSTKAVFANHMLRNGILPVITFMAMALSDMVAGSIIIEQVFSIPGIGRILLTSISGRDYPVVQAIIVCIAAFILVINFIVDLLYKWMDPRMNK